MALPCTPPEMLRSHRHPDPIAGAIHSLRDKRMFDMPEFRRFFRVNDHGVDFLKFAMQDRATFSCIA
jgi:hypothetical protein